MLDAWIIEEIRKREEEARRRRDDQRHRQPEAPPSMPPFDQSPSPDTGEEPGPES